MSIPFLTGVKTTTLSLSLTSTFYIGIKNDWRWTMVKKRIGRPTKPPKPGERVPIGLRVTAQMKRKLEEAATEKGRSLSQEAEMRLQNSLSSDWQLTLVYRGYALPVIRREGGLFVALPVGIDEYDNIDDELLPLHIAPKDLQRIRNYFAGTPPPYGMSWAEINKSDEEESIQDNIDEQEHQARLAKRRK
jgi:TraY domain